MLFFFFFFIYLRGTLDNRNAISVQGPSRFRVWGLGEEKQFDRTTRNLSQLMPVSKKRGACYQQQLHFTISMNISSQTIIISITLTITDPEIANVINNMLVIIGDTRNNKAA